MHRTLVVSVLTGVLALALAQTALALGLSTASGPTPFGGCSTPSAGGTNFLNTEVEPWLAANRATAGNLIAVYQQDRWSNGGAHGLVAAASFDGGATWSTRTPTPSTSSTA